MKIVANNRKKTSEDSSFQIKKKLMKLSKIIKNRFGDHRFEQILALAMSSNEYRLTINTR